MTEISFELPDRDERGVSPVIGVILMVAITVILAAVIASFVLGFGDSVQENVQAGADIQETDDGNASVTWISEGNAANLNISVTGNSTNVKIGGTNTTQYQLSDVGDTVDITATSTEEITVTVTAIGSNGAKSVVVQKDVTVGN